MLIMTDEYIINNFIKNGKIRYRGHLTEEIITYLNNRFVDKSDNIKEAIYRIYHKIYKRPVCPICGSRLKFVGKHNRIYTQTCSNEKCISLNAVEKTKTMSLEKYGVENPFQSEEVKNKIKQTCLEKYGVEHAAQSEEVKNKIKQTCLSKYGVACTLQVEEVKNKIKQTCLKKYGVDNPVKVEEVKNKIKKTCLYKYGVENAIQSKEIQQKIHETKKKNGSYGKSKEEDYVYSALVDMYGKDNVERQYSSDLYPFACDFYIISKDLYIEYNGIWIHGHTPYIGSKENEMKLKEWKQKAVTSDYYKRAIVTWTISDVKKRNTAKENNLNYIELWNLNDIISILNK